MSQIQETTLLAPFEVWEVQLGDRTIKFFEPLLLTPFWLQDDSDGLSNPSIPDREYLGVERPDLEIFANGSNRRELWNCICGDVRSAWVHFVRAEPRRLSPHGAKIKENYLRIAEEVDNG